MWSSYFMLCKQEVLIQFMNFNIKRVKIISMCVSVLFRFFSAHFNDTQWQYTDNRDHFGHYNRDVKFSHHFISINMSVLTSRRCFSPSVSSHWGSTDIHSVCRAAARASVHLFIQSLLLNMSRKLHIPRPWVHSNTPAWCEADQMDCSRQRDR